jgi:hypothetical protein
MYPEIAQNVLICLNAMQEEYHDACAARDFYKQEFNRLATSIMAEKTEESKKSELYRLMGEAEGKA